MKTKTVLPLLLVLTFTSCQEILDRYWEQEEEENYVSPYQGTYKGSYSGDETGNLTIEVAKNGYTSVTRTSQFGTESSFVSGMVRHDGALQSVKLQSGFVLEGNFNVKAGNWRLADWKGSWSVQKQ